MAIPGAAPGGSKHSHRWPAMSIIDQWGSLSVVGMRVTVGDGRAAELPLYANGGVGANGSAILEAEHSSPGCQSAGSRRLPGSGGRAALFPGDG